MSVELSVIIPAYNAADTLVDQLDALVRQRDAPSFEVIISDNGSRDETRDVAMKYGAVHPFIRWVDSSDRQGAGHARNAGAAAAAAHSLAFCDADDVVGHGWVSAMAAALREHAVVTGPMEYAMLNKPWIVEARGQAQVDSYLYIRGGPAMPYCFSANLGVQAKWHRRVGGFDEQLLGAGEDADYAWRLQRAGAALGWDGGAVVHYRLRDSMPALFRQMRAYTSGHRLLYERHADLWPLPPPVLDRSAVGRNALKRLWWVRSHRGLGSWVKVLGWEAGYAAGENGAGTSPEAHSSGQGASSTAGEPPSLMSALGRQRPPRR